MTNHRYLKALIRLRMAKTGEAYTTARGHVLRERAARFGERATPTEADASIAAVAQGTSAWLSVIVEPRFELMAILARLAEYPEYVDVKTNYATHVDQYFAPFRQHAAVEYLKFLRQSRGFDAERLLEFTVKLRDTVEFDSKEPFAPSAGINRGTLRSREIETLREHLRTFVRRSSASDYLSLHAETYREATRRLDAAIDTRKLADWLVWFHGPTTQPRFFLIPSLLSGHANVTASCGLSSEHQAFYGVISSHGGFDEQGVPTYRSPPELEIVELLSELRIRYEVAAHENPLRSNSEELFLQNAPHAADDEPWHSQMTDSISSAVVAIFVRKHEGALGLKRWLAKCDDDGRRFWIAPLIERFIAFETDRLLYVTLGDFIPSVVDFFSELSKRHRTAEFREALEVRQQAKTAEAPRIFSVSPPIGATDVNPDLTEVIVVFDRKMDRYRYAVCTMGNHCFPDILAEPSFDESATVFSIPVRLRPGTEYGFYLNAGQFTAFFDLDGNALFSTPCTFKTAPGDVR